MKLVKRILKTIVPFRVRRPISRMLRIIIDNISMQYKKMHRREYPLIKQPEKVFPVIYNIKKESYEKMLLAQTYFLSEKSYLWGYSPSIDILKLNNAVVSERSDIVVCKEGAIYDRMRSPLFSVQILCDTDLISYTDDKLSVIRYDKMLDIKGECVSLLGPSNATWAHFLIQYFPKLGFLDRSGLLNKNVQVLIPKYGDTQIKELLEAYQVAHIISFVFSQ